MQDVFLLFLSREELFVYMFRMSNIKKGNDIILRFNISSMKNRIFVNKFTNAFFQISK